MTFDCYGTREKRHKPSQPTCSSSARLWAVETKDAGEVDEMGAIASYSLVTSLGLIVTISVHDAYSPASRCPVTFGRSIHAYAEHWQEMG